VQIGSPKEQEEQEHPIEKEIDKDEEEDTLHTLYLYMPSDHRLQGIII
jgi:ribosomal protein L20A (L18A)